MAQQTTEPTAGSLCELGPVDRIVLELPGSRSTGEIAPLMADLVDRGTAAVVAHGVAGRTGPREDRREDRRDRRL